MAHTADKYYVPHGSRWPFLGSIGLFVLMGGFAGLLDGTAIGKFAMLTGAAIVIFMVFGWFRTVIGENQAGTYNLQVDRSFRMGMAWFIASEVMFFAAFFGALFYARQLAVPWLSGAGAEFTTNKLLWGGYEGGWPTNGPGNVGGPFEAMEAWGIPALNTAILLSSGVTVTIAHHALKAGNRGLLIVMLAATFLLGFTFVGFQAYEYTHAYEHMNLTLHSGVYGSTFFMLTGFHGLHVTLGAIMLVVIWARCVAGHFTPERHFAFEGVAWYWHFVDVVWLGLFIFVYWL
jgi:cytochrome c oxidase subunit III